MAAQIDIQIVDGNTKNLAHSKITSIKLSELLLLCTGIKVMFKGKASALPFFNTLFE